MGRWSRALAHQFVQWIDATPQRHWLDIGCGTGALTSAICANANPASVVACDPSEPFIAYARSQNMDERASYAIAGAENFPLRDGGYDTIASLLALNFFPAPAAAVGRMKAALSAGGVVAACVWDYAKGMQYLRMFWDAAKVISPEAAALDEGVRFRICDPIALEELFSAAGLTAVETDELSLPTRFSSFDDYWAPLLGGTGPAPAFVASLDEAARTQLRRELEHRLPTASDGSIELTARAWTVRGYNEQYRIAPTFVRQMP
jgi:SAM-dependent methyltransferase